MGSIYAIVDRIRMISRQRREEAELSRMSAIELQDIGYPHRLQSLPCRGSPEVPMINPDALSKGCGQSRGLQNRADRRLVWRFR